MQYLSDDDILDIESELLNECGSLQSNIPPQDSSREPTLPPPMKKRNLGTLFKGLEEEAGNTEEAPVISPEQKLQEEVLQYKAIKKLDFEDPLLWWKLHSPTYPILSNLAFKYLCVCATSTSSERLFSTSGNIVTPTRSHLNPDKVEMLTFLAKNLD